MAVETLDRSRAEFDAESNRLSSEIDEFFEQLLQGTGDARDRLYEAMRHGAVGGGKRLRPLLTSAAAQLFAIDPERALRVGAAIEAIHVYSLIHDDLPCMDNDDLAARQADRPQGVRRGRSRARRRQPPRAGVRDPRPPRDPRRPARPHRTGVRAGARRRAVGHGRRADDGPRRRRARPRPAGDHPAAAIEDRRADRIFGRGGVHHGAGRRARADAVSRLCAQYRAGVPDRRRFNRS